MASKPTLAMLLDSAPRTWSSAEELHFQLSRALIARGMRVILIFSEAPPEELASRFRFVGAEVAAINYRNGALYYFRELGRILKKHSVTAVHIAFFNYFDLVPWIVRMHGVRHIVYHERNSGVLRSRGWKKTLIQLRARVITQPILRVVAISGFIRQQLIDVGVPGAKVFVVRHGVDTRHFFPDPGARKDWVQQLAIEPDEVIASSIAHMRPFKHPEVIVQACALLAKRGVKVRFLMAGGGEMRREMEELSRKLGISGRIHWLGSVANPERLLQASDMFVLASVGEAFGLVLAEAMACGVPVVGSRSGAIPEIVEDGETGILTTPLDPASFADAIGRLAQDEELRRKMGTLGVDRVHRYFTLDTFVKNMLEVCEPVWRGDRSVSFSGKRL